MDGGSTDGSVEVLAANPHVLWSSEPDRGQANALNKAFTLSSGQIIGWLNSDDAYFDRHVLEGVVTYFDRHPDIDVAYGHAARVNAVGRIVYLMWAPPFSYRFLHWVCFLFQPAVFVRRSTLSAGFLDESYEFAMDWELWLRLAAQHRFGRLDKVLAVDRTHPERKMKSWLPVLERERMRLSSSYGVSMPFLYKPMERAYHIATRLGGARFVGTVRPADLSFPGSQDSRRTLLLRQIASRKKHWPDEDK